MCKYAKPIPNGPKNALVPLSGEYAYFKREPFTTRQMAIEQYCQHVATVWSAKPTGDMVLFTTA